MARSSPGLLEAALVLAGVAGLGVALSRCGLGAALVPAGVARGSLCARVVAALSQLLSEKQVKSGAHFQGLGGTL